MRVPARFTFVFHRTPVGWLIVSYHSSVVPPGPPLSNNVPQCWLA